MTINKIEESIQIAEELAKEICTGKESDSLSAQQWKKGSSELYKEIRSQSDCLHRPVNYMVLPFNKVSYG